jgi:hypothetical protein
MTKKDDGLWMQFTTEVPDSLYRDLKVHCIEADTSLMAFVVDAIAEKLAREHGHRRARS